MSDNAHGSDAERLQKSVLEIQRIMQAEINKLKTVVSELEAGYQNSAELCLTYHGELERTKAELARLRLTLASLVEAARRTDAENCGSALSIMAHRLYDALIRYDPHVDDMSWEDLSELQREIYRASLSYVFSDRDMALEVALNRRAASERAKIIIELRQKATSLHSILRNNEAKHYEVVAVLLEFGDHAN